MTVSPPVSHKHGHIHDQRQFFRLVDHALAIRYARELQNRRVVSPLSLIFKPRMDMLDNPDAPNISATLELPGLKKEEVSLRINEGSLIVWGERRSRLAPADTVKGAQFPVQEVKYGKFRRVIPLPQGIQTKEISAFMTEGMLTITWPRGPTESTQPIAVD